MKSPESINVVIDLKPPRNGKVTFTTDKLKRFHDAKRIDASERNKWEDLWVRYERERCLF